MQKELKIMTVTSDDVAVIFFELYENNPHLEERLYSVTTVDAHVTPTAQIMTQSQLDAFLQSGNSQTTFEQILQDCKTLAQHSKNSASFDAAVTMATYIK